MNSYARAGVYDADKLLDIMMVLLSSGFCLFIFSLVAEFAGVNILLVYFLAAFTIMPFGTTCPLKGSQRPL